MSNENSAPISLGGLKTSIMLIHGAWVTPASWDPFRSRYESLGARCLTPAWPFMDKPVQSLRDQPADGFAQLTIEDLVDHHERLIRAEPTPPILIGHSFGGLIVQMLLDRGLGAAGVAIDPAPPRGILPSAVATWSALPIFLTWQGWRRALRMSFRSFAETFANGLPPAERRAAYDRHIVPAPGRIYFQAALGVGNAVHFDKQDRPPMLLIAGEKDRTVTASMVVAMRNRYQRSSSRVEMLKFPGRSHWLIAEPGWEEVADAALEWAAKATAATSARE
jgi:pimeloyl-ACP methyl ester carboxylesterase